MSASTLLFASPHTKPREDGLGALELEELGASARVGDVAVVNHFEPHWVRGDRKKDTPAFEQPVVVDDQCRRHLRSSEVADGLHARQEVVGGISVNAGDAAMIIG